MSSSILNRKLPTGWHWARFDEFLRRIERKIIIDDLSFYDCVGVRWYGMGSFVREKLPGINIARKQQWLIKPGDIVYNKLFAWKGAFAMADDSVDGCIVSDKFPTYQLDIDIVNPQFLRYYFHTIDIAQQSLALSKGGAAISKLTLNPPQFWDLVVALPPLVEQQRIVARIEELVAKIEEAREVHQEAVEEVQSLFVSTMNNIWRNQDGWNIKPVSDLVTIASGLVDPRDEPYASLPHINGEAMESGTGKLLNYRIAKDDGLISGKFHFNAGAILYSKIRPYLRKAVQVPVEGVCSADVYAFASINPVLEPRFFMYSLIAPPFTEYANNLSGRTRMPKLNQRQLFSFYMSYPTISDQQRIVTRFDKLQAKLDTLKCAQSEASAKLNAMLPSILDKAFKGEL